MGELGEELRVNMLAERLFDAAQDAYYTARFSSEALGKGERELNGIRWEDLERGTGWEELDKSEPQQEFYRVLARFILKEVA
jgi:hypothetical protein